MIALRRRATPLALAAAILALGAGCSSKSTEPAFPDEPGAKGDSEAMPASAPQEKLPPGTIARSDLDLALMRGPGWLLSKITPEEVLRQNKFIGWRLISLPADWDGAGLQPGDVITEVNGSSMERPEDLWAAWMAATEANEIKIAFERDGKPAVTVLKVQGAIEPGTKRALESGVMAAAPSKPGEKGASSGAGQPAGKKRFETKVIQGSQEPAETSDY